MTKEKRFTLYFKRRKCWYCGKEFEIGETVVCTSSKVYHKSCYEKLLH